MGGLGGSALGVVCDVYHVGEPEDNDSFGSIDQQTAAAAAVASSQGSLTAPTAISGAASTVYGYKNDLLLDLVPYDSNSGYKEHATCSGRGSCDSASGICECYDGFT